MIKFREYIDPSILLEDKNTHLEHLEDDVFDNGIKGVQNITNFITSVIDMLHGTSPSAVNITTKWDGSPSTTVGINPENGKFFVSTKSLFNATPKVNYTNADIDANHGGGLADKLKTCLRYLPELGIKTIYQGDLLYTDDLSSKTIDGERYITFQPNTIVYAVPENSQLAETILSSKMGIVFHTEYKGKTLKSLNASFNINISGLRRTKNVWFQDAYFKDVSGQATLTSKEFNEFQRKLLTIKALSSKINIKFLTSIVNDSNINLFIKTYTNQRVREGLNKNDFNGLVQFVANRYEAEINKLKTETNKIKKTQERDLQLRWLQSNKVHMEELFELHGLIADLKTQIIRKLESVGNIPSFIRTDTGFKVTAPEGFVAVDKISNKAVKLVDRLEFSRANFTAAKNWVKG